MKTSLTISVVVTTLVMILRCSQSQIQIPNRPTARPGPSGETNSRGSRKTTTENLMIPVGPNGRVVPYKMTLQMQPSQVNNTTEELEAEDILFMWDLIDTFMPVMRKSVLQLLQDNSSMTTSSMDFMLQMQPETVDNVTKLVNAVNLAVNTNILADSLYFVSNVVGFGV